jgi:hypothetical protein
MPRKVVCTCSVCFHLTYLDSHGQNVPGRLVSSQIRRKHEIRDQHDPQDDPLPATRRSTIIDAESHSQAAQCVDLTQGMQTLFLHLLNYNLGFGL